MRFLIIAVTLLLGLSPVGRAQINNEVADAISNYQEVSATGTTRDVKEAALSIHSMLNGADIPERVQPIFYDTSLRLINRGDYLNDARTMLSSLEATPNRLAYIQSAHLDFMKSLVDWYENPTPSTRKAVGKQIKAIRKVPPNREIYGLIYAFVSEDEENDKARRTIRRDAAKVFEKYKQTFPVEWGELEHLAAYEQAIHSGNSKWIKNIAEVEGFLGQRLITTVEIDGPTEDLYLEVKQTRVGLQEYMSGAIIIINKPIVTRRDLYRRALPQETLTKIFNKYDYDPDAVQALLDE